MEINVYALTDDKEILKRARVTVWKSDLPADKEPSERFLRNVYMARHSPIRDKWFSIEIRGIKSWVATHLVRHHIGYTPYVSTQRDDRISYEGNRDTRGQGELVNMDITLNAEAFMNVSAKRLCGMAHPETQEVWNQIVEKLKEVDPILYDYCVPSCIRLGFCPEIRSCKRCTTEKYINWRKDYTKGKLVIPNK